MFFWLPIKYVLIEKKVRNIPNIDQTGCLHHSNSEISTISKSNHDLPFNRSTELTGTSIDQEVNLHLISQTDKKTELALIKTVNLHYLQIKQ